MRLRPDPDDHRGDGGRHGAAHLRHRRGRARRFDIGVVIFSGMAIGTLFTLFVTPAVYTFLARDHAALIAKEKALGHLKEEVEAGEARERRSPLGVRRLAQCASAAPIAAKRRPRAFHVLLYSARRSSRSRQ